MKLTISIKTIRMALAGLAVLSMSACEGLLPDNKVDLDLTDKNASQAYTNLKSQGMMLYDYLPTGYNRIDGAMLAAATDEADHAPIGSDIEKFQLGTWNAVTNPDNNWSDCYRAIRLSALFLQNSENYETIILRDTSTASKLNTYKTQCADLKALRAEARILNAYMYFELLKRFGGVPLIDKLYSLESHPDMERSTYDQVVTHIVGEIDDVLDNDELEDDWYAYDQKQYGRFTQGAALALKSRILLYRASPQNNPSGDTERWKEAAQAAHDLIELSKYTLEGNYGNLFSGTTSHQSKEVILAYMTGANNTPETDNYPISTNGGKTGTCPSANLVDAYENADGTPFDWNSLTPGDDPYAGRDPRLQYSIVVNDSQWNGRTMQCYDGGADGSGVMQATTTGYYLKKFLTDGLDLEKNQTSVHSWILFRYAEILLNYAEAMNEAYGPDTDPFGDGKTARWAVNEVRGRVGMPPVTASDETEMRNRIKHERRIELAFEDHRFWDVRRWGKADAESALGVPVKGVSITKTETGFTYATKIVGTRTFQEKMMLYPIPQSEILRSAGKIEQNPGW
ncbi:RagB/SusD family nutrient uptake outer membrane protein [Alistipes shahii]|jgi:hypothetical protein|uniref:RagB/SusD family nutrient uptake outer membrane protein n=2 Tax=Alistipes shahii TaxID=328814 RepID=UPI0026753C6A|nr:RagB/SusD family nutrient uptake outer membrane protein [Alistipes shahii]